MARQGRAPSSALRGAGRARSARGSSGPSPSGSSRPSAESRGCGFPRKLQASAATMRPRCPPKQRVLVVDDEPSITDLVPWRCATRSSMCAWRPADARRSTPSRVPPDLVVLDVMLPDIDGFEVARGRRRGRPRPRSSSSPHATPPRTRSRGLTLGGDDYMTKPFSVEELVARIRAILRRTGRRRTAPGRLASPTSNSTRTRTRSGAPGEPRAHGHRVQAPALPAAQRAPRAHRNADPRPRVELRLRRRRQHRRDLRELPAQGRPHGPAHPHRRGVGYACGRPRRERVAAGAPRSPLLACGRPRCSCRPRHVRLAARLPGGSRGRPAASGRARVRTCPRRPGAPASRRSSRREAGPQVRPGPRPQPPARHLRRAAGRRRRRHPGRSHLRAALLPTPVLPDPDAPRRGDHGRREGRQRAALPGPGHTHPRGFAAKHRRHPPQRGRGALDRLLLVEVSCRGRPGGSPPPPGADRRGLRPLEPMARPPTPSPRATCRGAWTGRPANGGRTARPGLNAMLERLEEAFRQREASEGRLRRFLADAHTSCARRWHRSGAIPSCFASARPTSPRTRTGP